MLPQPPGATYPLKILKGKRRLSKGDWNPFLFKREPFKFSLAWEKDFYKKKLSIFIVFCEN